MHLREVGPAGDPPEAPGGAAVERRARAPGRPSPGPFVASGPPAWLDAPVTASPARGLGEIIVSSRPLDEYRAMFGLAEADLTAGPVLDCPGGAGPFGAEVRARGGAAVSADPAYALDAEALVARVRAGMERAFRYLDENREHYRWTFFRDPEDLRARREAALARFAADYRGADERYVAAALPRLPFPAGGFRLALCGYLLFAYPDDLSHDDHLAALRELLRVAGEVRVYPLIDTAYRRYERLEDLRRRLADDGVESEVRRVDYELQRGGDEMLALRAPRATPGSP